MKKETQAAILTLAKADPTVNPELLTAMEGICLGQGIRRKLIGARSVRELLGAPEGRPISAPTLRRYVREGKINSIRLSCRKVRYDEREIQKLLNHGIETEGEK